MVSDQQVKRLWRLLGRELSLEIAAAKAGMDPKTARKYLRDRRLPSDMRQKQTSPTVRIRSPMSGNRFGSCSWLNQDYKPRPCFSICRKRIPADSVTDKYVHCGAGFGTGERQRDHRGKYSLLKNIGRGSCASRTSRTAGNWA